jgi:hypothetical protein
VIMSKLSISFYCILHRILQISHLKSRQQSPNGILLCGLEVQ